MTSSSTVETPRSPDALPDYSGFAEAVDALRREALDSVGQSDILHLRWVERTGWLLKLIGYLTAWVFPNPLSILCLSFGQGTRWAMAHHILHKGYDRIAGIPDRYTSRVFARGWRRFIDWFDWMIPAGWAYEHNILHHCYTGEDTDPDLVVRETEWVQEADYHPAIKYIILLFMAATWRFTFYAPNTVSVIDAKAGKPVAAKDISYVVFSQVFNFGDPRVRRLWVTSYLPYALWHFGLIPALFLSVGTQAAVFVLCNKLLAEILVNIHAFAIVVPNHTGDDVPRFSSHPRNRDQYYAAQVLGSVDYHCGTAWLDYSQMWLNYQIEHHLFPDLPMRAYRDVQPKVKALCERYGLAYVQESVWTRLRKMTDVCVGNTQQVECSLPASGRSEFVGEGSQD
jgi:fatty acid desaturase